MPSGAVRRFMRSSANELRPQLPCVEATSLRISNLRGIALAAGYVIELEWGADLPNPAISASLLEVAANQSEAIDWLSERLTTDDQYGCWALPLPKERDEKNRARYPIISSKRFESNSELAHRFVVRRLLGALATDEHLDHICRVHACCNPLHLDAVTHTTNMRRGSAARTSVVGQQRFTY
jgi:hypothetical protein